MILIYAIVVIFATIIGSISGLGGGMIIKPIFDSLAYHNTIVIAAYSSIAILTMATVFIVKSASRLVAINYKIILYLIVGSVVGGILGEFSFNKLYNIYEPLIMQKVQSISLIFILLLIIFSHIFMHKLASYHISNLSLIALLGLLLGLISTFLGIGGGPLNILLLRLGFSFTMKETVIYSISIIFFSQVAKLVMTLFNGTLYQLDLGLTVVIIIASILGGTIGSYISKCLNNKTTESLYLVVILALLALNFYNFLK